MNPMIEDIVTRALGLISTVLSAYILNKVKKLDAKNDKYFKERKEEAVLIMRSFQTGADLAIMTAEKLQDVKTEGDHQINGNLSAAIEERKKVQKDYNEFLFGEAASHKYPRGE